MTENIRFILASASPRRHELLSSVGIPHEILVTDADENPTGSPRDGESYAEFFAREASRLKCEAALSGCEHWVVGGITIAYLDGENVKTVSCSVSTAVTFKKLTDGEISAYIESGEPDGKAGAYAIQGLGAVFVTTITGDYPNVVGLSVSETCRILADEFGIRLTEQPRDVLPL